MTPAEIAALRERLGILRTRHRCLAEGIVGAEVHRAAADGFDAALALLDAQAAEIARLTAALEREGDWRRQAIRHARAIAIADAARVCEAMSQPKDGDLAWLLAERIRALAPAPAAEVAE